MLLWQADAVSYFHTLDLMARGGSTALLILWGWLLFRDHRDAPAARVALILVLAIICHVLVSYRGVLRGSPLDSALDVGSCAVIGLFWLFTRVWFDDLKRVDLPSILLVAAPPAVVAIAYIFSLFRFDWFVAYWFPMLRIIWFSFIASALWIAWRGRADDLVEARRKMRLKLVVTIGLLALLVNSIEVAVFAFGAPPSLRTLPEFAILICTLILSAAMFQHRQLGQFGPAKRVVDDPDAPCPSDDPSVSRLLEHMTSTLPHRDESLTIAGLAQQLGEQEYKLRRLINGTLGYRNFAQFLNSYRLTEVKAALVDTSQKDVPILTIALDAGFGSLGPFNRAFREAEGMTPSAFRAQAG